MLKCENLFFWDNSRYVKSNFKSTFFLLFFIEGAWYFANSEFLTQAQTINKNTAQEAIGKIERLSKLVQEGQVNIHDVLMAGAIKDNISDGAMIALVNTMALLDREREQVRFTGQNPSGNYV